MKPYKSKPVKTEESLERSQQSRGKNDWVFHSVLKHRKRVATPLRFADFIHKKDREEGSTNDRGAGSATDAEKMNSLSISKAINVLKDVSGKGRREAEEEGEEPRQITPFSLGSEMEDFQQEFSFKGASNRLHLLGKLEEIESEANRIFLVVQSLNHNSSIDFITFKLLKSRQHHLNLSYYDFYTHLEVLAKKVSDFVTELARCRQIMAKIAVGISKRTMDLYISKFQDLVRELKRSLEHLQSYVDLLGNLQRQEKRTAKKYLLAHKGGPAPALHA